MVVCEYTECNLLRGPVGKAAGRYQAKKGPVIVPCVYIPVKLKALSTVVRTGGAGFDGDGECSFTGWTVQANWPIPSNVRRYNVLQWTRQRKRAEVAYEIKLKWGMLGGEGRDGSNS